MSDEFGGLAGEVRRLQAENAKRTEQLGQALTRIVQAEIELKALREENADLRKRIADLEARHEPKSVEDVIANDPGFFNAENMDYLHKMVHTNRLAIEWLSDRVAQLERAQREGQGEI